MRLLTALRFQNLGYNPGNVFAINLKYVIDLILNIMQSFVLNQYRNRAVSPAEIYHHITTMKSSYNRIIHISYSIDPILDST